MRKINNERHMEIETSTSNLNILRELNKRDALDEELTKELKRVEAKNRGLKTVLNHLNHLGKNHWVYMINVSLDSYNIFNCDLLLMTSTHLYPLEINHYDGLFEFKKELSLLNGKEPDQLPIESAQCVATLINAFSTIRSINLDVKGAAIFPSSTNQIRIYDEVPEIEIVGADQLDAFIKQMIRDEKNRNSDEKIDPRYIRWLREIDQQQPIWTIHISDEMKEHIHPGIACRACNGFDVTIGNQFVSCPCGKYEPLEEAIVRTICEYGVLNYEKSLYPPDLHLFFDNQISMEQIETCLAKHFSPVG